MSPFEYIIGIHSIVLGLALANALSAISQTLKHRATLKLYWVHTGWCVFTVFVSLAWWWALWQILAEIEVLSLFGFFRDFIISIFLYVISKLLDPELGDEKRLDLESYFFRIKTPFFILWILLFAVLGINNFSAAYLANSSQYSLLTNIYMWASMVVRLILVIWALISSNRRVQVGVLCAIFVTALIEEVQQSAVGQ